MAATGDFTPVLAKHSKSFSLIDGVSVGVDPLPIRRPCGSEVAAVTRSQRSGFARGYIQYPENRPASDTGADEDEFVCRRVKEPLGHHRPDRRLGDRGQSRRGESDRDRLSHHAPT
jgi:hypothetical protein